MGLESAGCWLRYHASIYSIYGTMGLSVPASDALDIHRVAGAVVLDPLYGLSGAEETARAPDHHTLSSSSSSSSKVLGKQALLDSQRATNRTSVR